MRALWRWLTEPPVSFTGADRQRARMLASFFVVVAPLASISTAIQVVIVPGFVSTFVLVQLVAAFMVLAWLLLRAGRDRAAALIGCVIPSAASVTIIAMNPADLPALAFVSLGIVLASWLMPARFVVLFGTGAIAAVLLLPAIQPAVTTWYVIAFATFNAIVMGLLVIAARHRDALEAQRLSEQARLHESLLRSDRLASLGMLAAGIAHEVKNPLTCVKAYLDLLELRIADDPTSKQYIDGMGEGVARISKLASRWTGFARGSDGIPSRDVRADVQVALEASLAMAEIQIRYRARLVRTFAPTPPARADRGHLEQIFLNLLINAAQAIPLGAADQHEIRVELRSTGGQIEASVSDTGVGIPPDQLERVFEPFVTTKPLGEGTGLGLAICRDIVTAFGGKIDVQSKVGAGTTFRVQIPAVTHEEQVAADAADRGAEVAFDPSSPTRL